MVSFVLGVQSIQRVEDLVQLVTFVPLNWTRLFVLEAIIVLVLVIRDQLNVILELTIPPKVEVIVQSAQPVTFVLDGVHSFQSFAQLDLFVVLLVFRFRSFYVLQDTFARMVL